MLLNKKLDHHIRQRLQCLSSKFWVTETTSLIYQKLLLEIKCKISLNNDGDLGTGTDAAKTAAPYLSYIALNSFFSDRTVSANDVQIYKTNENYAHKDFIETKYLSGKTAKNTWLVCQGYYYEDEPAKNDGTDV